jgi:hypothetical protein
MTLIIQKPTGAKLNLRKTWQPMDADAAAYITAVETADTQALEERTKIAIDNFVLGCKEDGIWTAIKASCILAGARTLTGALVPLVGTAPTRQGTEGDWNYDRKTGLAGNGTNNYLNSGFLATGISASSNHLLVNGSSFPSSAGAFRGSIGAFASADVRLNMDLCTSGNGRQYRGPTNTAATLSSGLTTSGSVSGSRLSTTLSTLYQNGAAVATNTNSAVATMPGFNFFVYALNLTGSPADLTSARFNFYGIGDGLTNTQMTAYHARVTDLINAFAAAIP